MSILDDLLVELGYDYDPEALESFQNDLDSTVNSITKLVAAAAAGAAAIFGLTAASTSATDEQGKMANQIGVTVESLDALEFANKRAGGTADGMRSSLEQLSTRIGETARGVGAGIEAFGLLGISVTEANGELRDTSDVLLDVAESFEGLSRAQQIELSDKLGLRDSIRLLQEGRTGIEELTDEARRLGVSTSRDAAIAAEFQDGLTDIFKIGQNLSRLLSRTLAPAITEIAHDLTEWWVANKVIIEQNMPMYIEKAVFALKLLTAAAVAFIATKIVATVGSLITLFKGATVSALAFNAAVAALPLLIASLIGGITLLAEDAKTFFDGGKSFIGEMLEKYPQWTKEITTVAAIFATLYDVTMMIFEGWGKIFDLFTSGTFGEDLKLVFGQIRKDLGEFVSGLFDDVKMFFSDVKDTIKDALTFNLPGLVPGVAAPVFEFFTGQDGENSNTENTTSTESTNVENTTNTSTVNSVEENSIINNSESLENSNLTRNDYRTFSENIESTNINNTELMNIPDMIENPQNDVQVIVSGLAADSQINAEQQQIPGATNLDNSTLNQSDIINNTSNSKNVELSGDININLPNVTEQNAAQEIKRELDNLIQQTSIDSNTPVDL